MTSFNPDMRWFSSDETESNKEEEKVTLLVIIEHTGATLFSFLEPLEVLRMQGINFWLHLDGVALS